jgi:hypothetical protein
MAAHPQLIPEVLILALGLWLGHIEVLRQDEEGH